MNDTELGNEYVLAGGDVVAGEDLALLRGGYVVVRDGVIAAVGAGGPPSGLPVVDMTSNNLAYSLDPIASLIERATSADIRAVLVDGRLVHGVL